MKALSPGEIAAMTDQEAERWRAGAGQALEAPSRGKDRAAAHPKALGTKSWARARRDQGKASRRRNRR